MNGYDVFLLCRCSPALRSDYSITTTDGLNHYASANNGLAFTKLLVNPRLRLPFGM